MEYSLRKIRRSADYTVATGERDAITRGILMILMKRGVICLRRRVHSYPPINV